MSFSKVTEYFYASASTIGTDKNVFRLLGKDEYMKAFEDAEEALQDFKRQGTEADVAAAMTTSAEVALALEEVEQATQLAEDALGKAKSLGSVKVEAAAMNVLAKAAISWSPNEAVVRAKDAMDVAKASGDVHSRACVCHTLANALVASGQGNQAIIVADEMVRILAGSDATGEACAMLCVSELRMAVAEHKAAIVSAKDAAEILRKAGDKPREALAWKYAASAALSSVDTVSEGFDLADKALSLFDAVGETKGQVPLKLDMANAKLRAEEYVEAEDLAEDAQATCKKMGDLYHEAESAQVLAAVRLAIAVEDAKDKDEADTMAATEASRDALVLFRKLGNRRGEATAMHKLAQVRYHAGAGDMAKMAAEEAQTMFRELGDVQGEAGAVLLIAHVMHKDEQLDGAKRAATKASTLYQSIGDNDGVSSCTEFLDKVKSTQTTKTREAKTAKKTVSDTGLVKLVNSSEEATHLLSFLADMNEDEDTELSEFDLSKWGTSSSMLKLQA